MKCVAMESMPLRVHLKVSWTLLTYSEQVLMTRYLKTLLLCAAAVGLLRSSAFESLSNLPTHTHLIQCCVV